MINALEIVGNLLDDASNEATKLPNQYTRGRLDGVKRVYQALANEIGKPQRETDEETDPFVAQRVNPATDQMIKYGERTYATDPTLDNSELGELIKIRELLEEFVSGMFPARQNLSQQAQQILHETQDRAEENYSQSETEDTPETPKPTRWNQSFGKGLGGQDFREYQQQPEPEYEPPPPKLHDEITYDPDTGEQGKVRTIGAKFNPDEEKTVEEWANHPQGRNHVYYDKGEFNELEDLQPGE